MTLQINYLRSLSSTLYNGAIRTTLEVIGKLNVEHDILFEYTVIQYIFLARYFERIRGRQAALKNSLDRPVA